MQRPLEALRDRLIDVVFPPQCGVCGTAGSFICPTCTRRLQAASAPRCQRCWSAETQARVCRDCATSPLDGARAPYVYDGPARDLVRQLKFEGLHALAEPMGALMASSLIEHGIQADIAVPVPLHGLRRRLRGFNQSELLARAIGQRTGIPLDETSLRTAHATAPLHQTDDRGLRETNVRGAFRCIGQLEGKRVLLVDDVLTTGATARECAAVLKAAGAASVWALAFCHTDRGRASFASPPAR
jgi:ComF family protein